MCHVGQDMNMENVKIDDDLVNATPEEVLEKLRQLRKEINERDAQRNQDLVAVAWLLSVLVLSVDWHSTPLIASPLNSHFQAQRKMRKAHEESEDPDKALREEEEHQELKQQKRAARGRGRGRGRASMKRPAAHEPAEPQRMKRPSSAAVKPAKKHKGQSTPKFVTRLKNMKWGSHDLLDKNDGHCNSTTGSGKGHGGVGTPQGSSGIRSHPVLGAAEYSRCHNQAFA